MVSLMPSGYCRRALCVQLAEFVRSSGSKFAFTTRSRALSKGQARQHIASIFPSLLRRHCITGITTRQNTNAAQQAELVCVSECSKGTSNLLGRLLHQWFLHIQYQYTAALYSDAPTLIDLAGEQAFRASEYQLLKNNSGSW